ncbi:MAG TPA: hypothetical protein VK721_03235 [Solirubrobacteraceae bacterium]|nr:hypothetical protein [Solirubrobacteraceae bacterium]
MSRFGGLLRAWLLVLTIMAVGGLWFATAASAIEVAKWEAGTCANTECEDSDVNEGKANYFYTQAAGHPDFGITDFAFKTHKKGIAEVPNELVEDVRVDLPPGLAVNPEATTAKCTPEELESDKEECPAASQVGIDEATGTATVLFKLTIKKEKFPVYNMVRKPGQPARFGVEVNGPGLDLAPALKGHIYLEGGISWHKEPVTEENSGVETGDYHEYFKIEKIAKEPEVVESRLVFWGVPQEHQKAPTEAPKAFLTLPSTCAEKPITYLHVDSYEHPGEWTAIPNQTPLTATGCSSLALDPTLSLAPETTQSDQPDGVTVGLHVPQLMDDPSKLNSPDVETAVVALPEGMTLNPSAAHGLVGCATSEFEAGACPAASNVGTFSVNAPGLPPGAVSGGVYVGSPEAGKGPESGGMYRIFLIGETPQPAGSHIEGGEYGVGLRQEGRVSAKTSTGRLTATFSGTPQVPVEDLTLRFKGGARAPLANPLSCGAIAPSAALTPYGGEPAQSATATGFTVDGNGAGGPCPLPFSLVQSLTPQSPANAGAYDPASFGLARASGQQYLSKISTTLPAGLVGAIPSVPLCPEANANAGTCAATSQIGTVTVAAGAGSEPYTFTGRAYLTGPYAGAPYGLSIVVPAVAGPYDLGEVVTRAGITVGLYSGRITVTATLPSIVGGVPLRLQSLNVSVNRPNFLFNPTSCAPLSTESVLTSTFGASQSLSSPFQVGGCGALAFKPAVSASSSANTSKLGGASLEVKVTEAPHQADIQELQLQLPQQLVARLTTLQKACLASEFETGPPPGTCKSTARTGTATVTTPVLPDPLKGDAYFVSHGAASFPDLDLVLHGDGVEVVLVGHTHIARSSITTSTFESLPDVPISSAVVSLPTGSNSAVSANGSLCGANLIAPTTIIAQSGARITQNTRIAVTGCPIEVISHKRRGRRLKLKVWVPEAGRLTVTGRGVKRVSVRVKKAGTIVTFSVPLTSSAMAALHGHGKKPKLRIGFSPKSGHNSSGRTLLLRG